MVLACLGRERPLQYTPAVYALDPNTGKMVPKGPLDPIEIDLNSKLARKKPRQSPPADQR